MLPEGTNCTTPMDCDPDGFLLMSNACSVDEPDIPAGALYSYMIYGNTDCSGDAIGQGAVYQEAEGVTCSSLDAAGCVEDGQGQSYKYQCGSAAGLAASLSTVAAVVGFASFFLA